MNKLAFISDIHGNYPALKAVLADIDKRGIEKIICLGDLVGYYSMINEVVYELRERKVDCIIGNHDYAMLYTNGVIERSKTCTTILKKQLTYIAPENFAYISSLPESLVTGHNGKSYFSVHGGLNDFIDEYLFRTNEDYFTRLNFKYDVLVTGHTHQLINEKSGVFTHLNPGSVGQPRDEDPRSAYLIIQETEAKHIRVEYDIDEIVSDMKAKGFEEYIYAGLYTGKKIG